MMILDPHPPHPPPPPHHHHHHHDDDDDHDHDNDHDHINHDHLTRQKFQAPLRAEVGLPYGEGGGLEIT